MPDADVLDPAAWRTEITTARSIQTKTAHTELRWLLGVSKMAHDFFCYKCWSSQTYGIPQLPRETSQPIVLEETAALHNKHVSRIS